MAGPSQGICWLVLAKIARFKSEPFRSASARSAPATTIPISLCFLTNACKQIIPHIQIEMFGSEIFAY